jgi:hypothetical protein
MTVMIFRLAPPGLVLDRGNIGVCVPPGSAPKNARALGTFTSDLEALANWLVECGVQTMAMEATGVYWILFSKSRNSAA